LPLAALAGALVLGCGDPPRLTAPADPLAPAPRAARGTEVVSLTFFDSRYTVAVGNSFEALVAASCGGPGDAITDQFDYLTVPRHDGSLKTWDRGKDVNVIVWSASAGDVCGLLGLPHLTGTGRIILHHFFDVDVSGHGADAIGFTLTGMLTDESGQKWHLVVATHGTVAPGSTDIFELNNHVEKIQLTPIGG
jgi:hypothetical protein